MAINNSSSAVDLSKASIILGETAIACDERKMLALEASWEIEQLSKLIMAASENFDTTETLIFRGLGARIKDLNSTIMSAIGEESMGNAELYRAVYKRPYVASSTAA